MWNGPPPAGIGIPMSPPAPPPAKPGPARRPTPAIQLPPPQFPWWLVLFMK